MSKAIEVDSSLEFCETMISNIRTLFIKAKLKNEKIYYKPTDRQEDTSHEFCCCYLFTILLLEKFYFEKVVFTHCSFSLHFVKGLKILQNVCKRVAIMLS